MKNILLVCLLSALTCCKQPGAAPENEDAIDLVGIKSAMSDENWKAVWRMMISKEMEKHELAKSQADSIFANIHNLDPYHISPVLEILLDKEESTTSSKILEALSKSELKYFCNGEFASERNYSVCDDLKEEPTEPELALELIKMGVKDQYARDNIDHKAIAKHKIDVEPYKDLSVQFIDEENRHQLKAIIAKHGFPTKQQVGKVGMSTVFILIQHADRDKVWQEQQLQNIALAVKNGDMHPQSYAYLYDRIQMNSNKKQRYGTQVKSIDRVAGTIELFEVEQPENLDQRRKSMGIIPIGYYEKVMLSL